MQDRHIGDVRVTRIEEQMGPGFPAKDFFPEFDADTFAAEGHWLAPSYYQPESGRLITSIHSWLLRTGKYTILVDACSGNHKPRPGMPRFDMLNSKYLERLREAGVEPEEIDFVMCTHLHVDHVGWNTRLENGRWVPTFPKARYLFSKTELDFWLAENDKVTVPPIADSVIPIVEAKRHDLVTSDHQLSDLVRLIPTPGHTIDHYAVTLGKTGKDAVITGDLIHTPLQAKWPDLAMRIDYDPLQSSATRWKFLESMCDTSTQCCFAHFPSPSRGYVKRWGDGFKCEYITG
jgi:glyoxylase-like metal-dependent hydrolase (beta-lactamase superfamily II)